MHSVTTMAHSRGIEMVMDGQAQNKRRQENDPHERRFLAHLFAELRDTQADNAKLAKRIERTVAMVQWLMEFNDAEDHDHDGTDISLRQACEILEGINAVGLKDLNREAGREPAVLRTKRLSSSVV